MEAAREEGQPNEYFDTSYAELAELFSAYYGVGTDQLDHRRGRGRNPRHHHEDLPR